MVRQSTAREAHSEVLEVLTTFCESTCVKARVHDFLTCCTQSAQRMVTAGYSRNFMQPFQVHKHRCIWCMWQVGWTIMDMKWWMLSVGRLVQASICDRSAVIFGPVSQHPLLTATGRSFFLVLKMSTPRKRKSSLSPGEFHCSVFASFYYESIWINAILHFKPGG